jgi:hypothetical protein
VQAVIDEEQSVTPTDAERRTLRPFPVLAGLIALFFVAETVAIYRAGAGAFTYALDDAYIHLSLAEQLRQGHYGINPGEAATPSSSVLWPFLLVPTAGTALHAATPLLLSFAATVASGWLLLRLLDLVTDGAAARRPVAAAALAAVPLALLNWAAVAFTGMEHSAHIAATLAVSAGLVQASAGRSVPWWLVAGLVAGPLLRYEGLAVTVAGGAVLAWWGHRRVASLSVAGAVAPLAAFSLWAVASGLDPLPSSVLVKSAVASGTGQAFDTVTGSLAVAFSHPAFAVLAAAVFGHLVVRREVTPLHLFALAVMGAHAVGGQFGWFYRYELYAYAAVVPVLAYLLRRPLRVAFESAHAGRAVVATVALTLAVAGPYLRAVTETPGASANIALQQAQMARFVSDYWQQPVAVNDLGLVAYQGGEYVLDLWGLASQEAREARLAGSGNAWMAQMADEHDVSLAMVYTNWAWFPVLPESWERVGVLTLDVPPVTVGLPEVTFLATSERDAERLRDELESFAGTLPVGAHLTLTDPPA